MIDQSGWSIHNPSFFSYHKLQQTAEAVSSAGFVLPNERKYFSYDSISSFIITASYRRV
ncbi:MAG: hypothetical protein PVG66_16900 [Chromatiales bacterium]|jgi:hypothetical protein